MSRAIVKLHPEPPGTSLFARSIGETLRRAALAAIVPARVTLTQGTRRNDADAPGD
jgi:hypothetical protein